MSVYGGARRGEEAAEAAADTADMEASAAARGERVAEAAGGDVVRAATAEAAEALRGGAAAQHDMAA